MDTKILKLLRKQDENVVLLSQRAGGHYPSMCAIARGDLRAKPATRETIATALGVRVEDVFDERGYALEVE